MEPRFKVLFLAEAAEFLDRLDEKAREKILYNIFKSRVLTNTELFRKLSAETWEFRTLHKQKYYRLFAFWDKTDKEVTVVVSTHGMIKKTNKAPKSEIEKAERLRKHYFEQKKP